MGGHYCGDRTESTNSAGFGLVGLMRRIVVSGADYRIWRVALNNDGLSRRVAGGQFLLVLCLAFDAGRLAVGKNVQ